MSYTSLLMHVVFATKSRHRWIHPEIEFRLHRFVQGIVRNVGATCIAVGGFDDHLHIIADLPGKLSVAEFAGKVKANSSRFAHDSLDVSREHGWQKGYSAFSVSRSNLDRVVHYVRSQREHHQRIDFDAELRKLLDAHEITYDGG
ncbi:MAG: IS200/IS605 family transposase [Thermoanaerobaculia bacterium]